MTVIDEALTMIVLRVQKVVKRIKNGNGNGRVPLNESDDLERLWEINSDLLEQKPKGVADERRR